jgi:glucose/mannose transport system substrate-binding protein
VVLSVMGVDGYKKALVDLEKALTGPEMVKALTELKKVATYMDPDGKGQDWNLEAAKVINGKAGMQIMGDWAKSEWTLAKKTAGKDYQCVAFPGTDKAFPTTSIRWWCSSRKTKAPRRASRTSPKVLGENFQKVFSINKGSIPVRNDMLPTWASRLRRLRPDLAKDFLADAKSGGLQPSMAHNMATTLAVQGAFFDVVTNYINDPKPTRPMRRRNWALRSSRPSNHGASLLPRMRAACVGAELASRMRHIAESRS